jgi:hypothetical protein
MFVLRLDDLCPERQRARALRGPATAWSSPMSPASRYVTRRGSMQWSKLTVGRRSPAAAGSGHFVAGGAGDVIGDLSAGRSSVAEVPRGSNVRIEQSL